MAQATRPRSARGLARLAEQQVAVWNERHPVGTPVEYWRGIVEGDGLKSKTSSAAEVLGGHTAVVWVEAQGPCIALTHVKPIAAA